MPRPKRNYDRIIVPPMEYVDLATGNKLPLFGLGTWLSTDASALKAALRAALDAGYRLIDTAQVYKNEAVIGEVLEEYFTTGRLKREEVFITTKLPFFVYTPEDIEKCFEKQLKDLRVDYIDLYLVHCPCVAKNVFNEKTGSFEPLTDGGDFKFVFIEYDHMKIWQTLEKLHKEGKAKAIGLSNFNENQVQYIIDNCVVRPHNLQVEAHLYWPQDELFELCKKNDITFTAYGPLGSPGRKVCDPTLYWPDAYPMRESVVLALAKKHGKTPAQILLRYLMQRGMAVIPKSVDPNRVRENFDVFDFKLNEEELKLLKDVPKRVRMFLFEWFFDSPYFPFDDVDKEMVERKMEEQNNAI